MLEAEIIGSDGKPLQNYTAIYSKRLSRFRAVYGRKIVADFETLGLLEQIKPHDLKYRMATVAVAPLLAMLIRSMVWRKPLAEVATKAVENGEIQFVPKQYENPTSLDA